MAFSTIFGLLFKISSGNTQNGTFFFLANLKHCENSLLFLSWLKIFAIWQWTLGNGNEDVWFISVNQPLGLRHLWLHAKFVCSGDYFHFLPRRIFFSLSMRLFGFQVQVLLELLDFCTKARTIPWKMALNTKVKKTKGWHKYLYFK